MEMAGMEKRSSCSTSISSSSMQNQQTHQLQMLMNKLDGVAVLYSLCGYYKFLNLVSSELDG